MDMINGMDLSFAGIDGTGSSLWEKPGWKSRRMNCGVNSLVTVLFSNLAEFTSGTLLRISHCGEQRTRKPEVIYIERLNLISYLSSKRKHL